MFMKYNVELIKKIHSVQFSSSNFMNNGFYCVLIWAFNDNCIQFRQKIHLGMFIFDLPIMNYSVKRNHSLWLRRVAITIFSGFKQQLVLSKREQTNSIKSKYKDDFFLQYTTRYRFFELWESEQLINANNK